MNYEVIEYKEILHEAFAGLLADFDRVIEKQGIAKDDSHPLCILEEKINLIWLDIFGDKYSTMEDMLRLRGQYELLNSYIRELMAATK